MTLKSLFSSTNVSILRCTSLATWTVLASWALVICKLTASLPFVLEIEVRTSPTVISAKSPSFAVGTPLILFDDDAFEFCCGDAWLTSDMAEFCLLSLWDWDCPCPPANVNGIFMFLKASTDWYWPSTTIDLSLSPNWNNPSGVVLVAVFR